MIADLDARHRLPGSTVFDAGNVGNIQKFYGTDNVRITLVVYGPGIHAVLKSDSPVAPRIAGLVAIGVDVLACDATLKTLKLTASDLIAGVKVTPNGLPASSNYKPPGGTTSARRARNGPNMEDSTTRSGFARVLTMGTAALAVLATSAPAAAASKTHRIAFHVDQNDPAVMSLVLNNMSNAATHYSGTGEQFEMELVAYGPGLHMLRADTSPVKDRLASIKDSIAGVTFSACNVTKTAMEKAEGHPITILPQARIVPAGVVRLVELQEGGWSYIKP